MAEYFFDSSALVKYYFFETGAHWVVDLIDDVDSDGGYANRIYVSDITTVEVASAIATLHRNGHISKRKRDELVEAFWSDMRQRYNVVPVRPDTLVRAARLTQQYPLKAYDAVQLATSWSVHEVSQPLGIRLVLVSSDNQLLAAARSENLATENPHDHP